VEPKADDQRHQPFKDLLGAAAFGTLTGDEHALLKSHVDGCAECQAELAEFRAIAATLPVTLDERVPSPELRDRIEAAVRQSLVASSASGESKAFARTWRDAALPAAQVSSRNSAPTAVPTMVRMPAGNGAPVAKRVPLLFRSRYVWATAALVMLAVLGGILAGRMLFAGDDEGGSRGEAIALQMDPPIPNATGELLYMPEAGVFKLSMENMPAAPAGQVYQVWMFDDNVPVPVGMVDQASGAFAVAAERSEYDMLAITVEPGPLGSRAPTGDPIVTAPLEESTDS